MIRCLRHVGVVLWRIWRNIFTFFLTLCPAPSIYENMDIKKGILLQLFSGSRKDFDNSARSKFRSDATVFTDSFCIFESPYRFVAFFSIDVFASRQCWLRHSVFRRSHSSCQILLL